MPFPGVNVNVTNGNLLKEINAADCVPGLLVTVKTQSLVAKVLKVYSLADAEKSGITQQAEPFAHALIIGFISSLVFTNFKGLFLLLKKKNNGITVPTH